MGQPLYNHEDPWHSNANMLGGFNCKYCDAFLTWNDEMMAGFNDEEDEFLRGCVAVSARAQATGWELLAEEWIFVCPTCAAQRRAG